MLQQPPEYKRLPLHHLHSKRLATEDFDTAGAPKTAPHAFSFFTTPEPSPSLRDSTPRQGEMQNSMSYDEPSFQNHHHQQSHHFVRGEVATKLWPRQGENYWFPNWQELFHGFLVVQEGQPQQTIVAGLEQSRSVASPQRQHTASLSHHSGTPCLHLGTSNVTQSPHHSTGLSQQQSTSSVGPCSGTRSHPDNATQLSHPSPTVSQAVAQTSIEEMDHTRSGHAQMVCPPSTQAPDLISKYTIKSPFWLPQGWVTEIQMRRTGTTAGTQDKYYKHIVSGRRFRSKSEVLHFIGSGKKRIRKMDRHKKVLSLSAVASHSFITNFAHKKHTILETSKPSSRGHVRSCPENMHPTHVGISLLPRQWAEQRPNGDSISSSSCSSLRQPGNMLPLSKEPAPERPQKLPLSKKAKILPLKIGEHRQASKLWQWLKKPVARDNGEPLNQDMRILNFSVTGIEKAASLMVDQRGVDDLTLRDQKSQRTIQLGKEIQAAHREMQATAEKLSREIQEAQKDVELGSSIKQPTMPAQTDLASTVQTKAGKRCREPDIDPRPCAVKTSAIQVSHGHDVATTEWLYFDLGNVTDAIRRPNDAVGILPHGDTMTHASSQATKSVMNATTHRRSPTQVSQMPVVGMRQVTQLALWPDAAPHHGTHSAQPAFIAKRDVTEAEKRHADATQSEQKDSVRAINGIQAAQRHVVAVIHAPQPINEIVAVCDASTQPAVSPEVSTVHTTTPATQMGYVALGSDTQAADRCVLVAGQATQMAYVGDVKQAIQRTHAAEVDSVVAANVTQSTGRQTIAISNLLPATQIPVMSTGQGIPSIENPPVENEMGDVAHKAAEGARADPIYAAQASASYGQDSGLQSANKLNVRRQDETTARQLRRTKFSAVLNPKLDLSRLNPALTTRQRAKVVQRMKTRHARELLATVGRHLCRKAIQRKPLLNSREKELALSDSQGWPAV